MKLKLVTGLYVALLAVVVFMASQREFLPLFRVVRRIPYGDKVGHLLLMGLLSFLVNLAFSCARVRVLGVNILKGSLIVFVVVTLEEISQRFLRYRTFDLRDLLFDYVGIFLFGQLADFVYQRRRRLRAK